MLKLTLFKYCHLLVLLVFILKFDIGWSLSDKRLCADPQCVGILSLAKAIVSYTADEKGKVSFKKNSNIRVKSKGAGSDPNLWGIEVNGRFGYAPKNYIQETQIIRKKEELIYEVPVELPEPVPEKVIQSSESSTVLPQDLKTTLPLEEIRVENRSSEPVIAEDKSTITPSSSGGNDKIPVLPNQTNVVDAFLNESVSKADNAKEVEESKKIEIADDFDYEGDDDEDDEDDDEDDDDDVIVEEIDLEPNSNLEAIERTLENKLKISENDSVMPPQSIVKEAETILSKTEEPQLLKTSEVKPSSASEENQKPLNINETEVLKNVNIEAESKLINSTEAPLPAVDSVQPLVENQPQSLPNIELKPLNKVETKTETIIETKPLEINETLKDSQNEAKKNVENLEKVVIDSKINVPNPLDNAESTSPSPIIEALNVTETTTINEKSEATSTLKTEPLAEDSKKFENTPTTINSISVENQTEHFSSNKDEVHLENLNEKQNLTHLESPASSEPLNLNIETKNDSVPVENVIAEALSKKDLDKEVLDTKEEINDSLSHNETLKKQNEGESKPIETEPVIERNKENEIMVEPEEAIPSYLPSVAAPEIETQPTLNGHDAHHDLQEPAQTNNIAIENTDYNDMNNNQEDINTMHLSVEVDKDDGEKYTPTPTMNPNFYPGYEVNEQIPDIPPYHHQYTTMPPYDPYSQVRNLNKNQEKQANLDSNSPDDAGMDFMSLPFESSQDLPATDSSYNNEAPAELPPDEFFASLSSQNSIKAEAPIKEEKPVKAPSKNLHNKHELKKHGLFANILGTVKNFIPSDNKLADFIDEKVEMQYCPSAPIRTGTTFESFINDFSERILEMADLVSCLAFVSATTLFFVFGYYCFCNSSRESNLISKLNLLERSMLATHKENSILKHELINTRNKLSSIEDSSFGSNDMVIALKQDIETKTEEIERLRNQVVTLEKELETATEAGLELNKIVTEMLNNQTGEDTIINSVEELQRQLNEQERTILEINANLAAKSRENSELQLEIAEQKAQMSHQIKALQTDNDELEAEKSVLQTRLTEMKSEFDQDITKALEGKNMEIKRLQSEMSNLQVQYESVVSKYESSQAHVQSLEDCLKELKKDNKDKVEDVLDFVNVRSQLLDIQKKYASLKESYHNQKETLSVEKNQLQAQSEELEKIKEQFHQSEKDKLEAQTRLEVLSSYFKEKEAQLQKELSLKEAMWFKQQGEATSTVDRLTAMQEEIQSLKSQNDALRAEIEAQIAAHKAQIGTLENRAHETWLAARQADRRCEEARAEAAALRRKLTSLATNPNDNALNMGLGEGPMHAEMKVVSPIFEEPPGAAHLLDRLPPPPFLPPHFMGPPPPGFMRIPPPFMPPEVRPAPLGRIMSPLPQQHSNHSIRRYFNEEFNDDSPDFDDEEDYAFNIPRSALQFDSPPITYRSHSPSGSRYDFEVNRDSLANKYDTETDLSPLPSPRRCRSWRSDEYDNNSPPPPPALPYKYERRKKSNSFKKHSKKSDH